MCRDVIMTTVVVAGYWCTVSASVVTATSLSGSVCLYVCLYVCVCVCVCVECSEPVCLPWFHLNKNSGQLTLKRPARQFTVSSVDIVVKATDDCYWDGSRDEVTWSPLDRSLLLVRVAVVMATPHFMVTSLYAAVVPQVQAGHEVLRLSVCLSLLACLYVQY